MIYLIWFLDRVCKKFQLMQLRGQESEAGRTTALNWPFCWGKKTAHIHLNFQIGITEVPQRSTSTSSTCLNDHKHLNFHQNHHHHYKNPLTSSYPVAQQPLQSPISRYLPLTGGCLGASKQTPNLPRMHSWQENEGEVQPCDDQSICQGSC